MIYKDENLGQKTLALQAGSFEHMVPPIDTAKTDPWFSMALRPNHRYSRSNPDSTVVALEKKVSVMHDGAEAIATSSGQGALIDILFTVEEGGHIIAGRQMYGATLKLIEKYIGKFASYTLVDPRDPEQLEDAVRDNTKYLLVETPTNPLLDIVDLERVQEFSQKSGIPYILDNTFATNQLLDGFRFGAHVVFYSASKYLCGHHNAIGGVAVTRDKGLAEELRENRRFLGHAISPFPAYLIYMGIQTLPNRMKLHCENAQIIAEYLAQHPMVSQVYYPGLPSHTGHEIAKNQMSGFGGMVSFKVNSDPAEFANNLAAQEPSVILLSESLGSVRSILAHPA